MEGIAHLQQPTHPITPPSAHPPMHTIHDISKSSIVMQLRKWYYKLSLLILAWLHCSTREVATQASIYMGFNISNWYFLKYKMCP